MEKPTENYSQVFRDVLEAESRAILDVLALVKEENVQKLVTIFEWLGRTGGNMVVCGVGKSGIVAQKIASTFCSLGLPSFFLHPTEALHGDLGRVSASDALVLISKSGTTQEILTLLPYLKIPREMTIGLLGNVQGPLSEQCSVLFDCRVEKEACPNNQAPTTSTTVTLAIGDAMAVVYEKLVGLSREKFAVHHPGGLLGKSLRLQVKDLMIKKEQSPRVGKEASLQDVILSMTQFPTGLCAVLGKDDELLGIIAEGDIRRTLMKEKNLVSLSAADMMTKKPITVSAQELAINALYLMEKKERQINVLPVTYEDRFVGVLRVHDLLKEGLTSFDGKINN